jgi:glycosyltransferase involved in cell wall biosynthesis
MKPLHVLMLPSFYSDPDKPTKGLFFRQQAQALRSYGLQVALVYAEPRSLRSISLRSIKESHFQSFFGEEDGLTVLRMRGWNPFFPTTYGGLIWTGWTEHLVSSYIERFGMPNVIHAQNALWAGYVAYRVFEKYGIPYVITEHSSAFPLRIVPKAAEDYVTRVYKGAAHVLTVSHSLARAITGYMSNRQPTVLGNVVDVDYFTLPTRLPARTPFIFLGIASLEPHKAFDLLIRAFARKFRGHANIELHIGGDGPDRRALESLARELGVEQKVRFLGFLSHERVRDAMWSANAFVLSSHTETFGVVLIEALCTGLPVIATRSGGPEDIVNSEVGVLVPAGDEEGLSDALEAVWQRPPSSRRDIRDYAVSRYGYAPFASKLQTLYLTAIK